MPAQRNRAATGRSPLDLHDGLGFERGRQRWQPRRERALGDLRPGQDLTDRVQLLFDERQDNQCSPGLPESRRRTETSTQTGRPRPGVAHQLA